MSVNNQRRKAAIDFFEKKRKISAHNKYQTDNIVCFYGPNVTQEESRDICNIVDFIEDAFEKIERDFDLQRFNKHTSCFAVYISNTGLKLPEDLPHHIQCATNEHFLMLSYPPLPCRESVLKELCHSLLHIPFLSIQESICQYITHTYLPSTTFNTQTQRLFLQNHYKNPFRSKHPVHPYQCPPLFWEFIAQKFGGGKTVGDIADFAFHETEEQTSDHLMVIRSVCKYMRINDETSLLQAWLNFLAQYNTIHRYITQPTALDLTERLEMWGFEVLPKSQSLPTSTNPRQMLLHAVSDNDSSLVFVSWIPTQASSS